jgi:hypothetical protein
MKIPLIKEYRIDKIKKCLICIDKHPFNRDKQKDCIIDLYPDKKDRGPEQMDKSMFRGMVIPSLRNLGLIIGYGDYIRLSANGKLIVESEYMDDEVHQRVLRVVIFEIDQNKFKFINMLLKATSSSINDIINSININSVSNKQKEERVKKWCSVLEEVGLIINNNKWLSLNYINYNQTTLDIDIKQKDMRNFKKFLFDIYFELGRETAGIVDIADLREKVAKKTLKIDKLILTENQFDEMLRNIPFVTDNYIISLGRPMGAEEKLFKYKEEYFRTLSIKSFKMR